MEKKPEKRNTTALLGDALLTVLSVGILGFTFYGLSAISPKSQSQIAERTQTVLGAKSDASQITYFPQSLAKVPYIKSSSFSGSTTLSGAATSTIVFKTLEPTIYEFTVTTIKNSGTTDRSVILTPSYSLEGSYTKISVLYDGQTLETVSSDGTISPVEIVVSANSIAPITVMVQPTTRIQVQPTLTLAFTEKP